MFYFFCFFPISYNVIKFLHTQGPQGDGCSFIIIDFDTSTYVDDTTTYTSAGSICPYHEVLPTVEPTPAPTNIPTSAPTAVPTISPTDTPTRAPSISPTDPTLIPTPSPTFKPSFDLSVEPTNIPSMEPSNQPTQIPSEPSFSPTDVPSNPTYEPIAIDSSKESIETTDNDDSDYKDEETSASGDGALTRLVYFESLCA